MEKYSIKSNVLRFGLIVKQDTKHKGRDDQIFSEDALIFTRSLVLMKSLIMEAEYGEEEYGFGRTHGYVSLKVISVQQDLIVQSITKS